MGGGGHQQELEGRLANERRDLEKMIAEVEQHAATLKEETVSAEESIRNRTREELLIQEEHEKLQSKEKELASLESALKKKAKIIEEHGQTISMLEMQVKDRLQRSADLEIKALELEKGARILLLHLVIVMCDGLTWHDLDRSNSCLLFALVLKTKRSISLVLFVMSIRRVLILDTSLVQQYVLQWVFVVLVSFLCVTALDLYGCAPTLIREGRTERGANRTCLPKGVLDKSQI